MSQKVKAPNAKNSNGFLWTIVAVIAIAAVVIGFIVVNQSKKSKVTQEIAQEQVSFSVSVKDNAVLLSSDKANAQTKSAQIFEDFACPHCANLSIADHKDVKDAVEKGEVNVSYHFMSVLNSSADSQGSMGGAAMLAVAQSGDASTFFTLHNFLMENQATIRSWDWSDYADAAAKAGADQSVVDIIKDKKNVEEAANTFESNLKLLQEKKGTEAVGTPTVYIEDEEYVVRQDRATGEVLSWVPDALGGAVTAVDNSTEATATATTTEKATN